MSNNNGTLYCQQFARVAQTDPDTEFACKLLLDVLKARAEKLNGMGCNGGVEIGVDAEFFHHAGEQYKSEFGLEAYIQASHEHAALYENYDRHDDTPFVKRYG